MGRPADYEGSSAQLLQGSPVARAQGDEALLAVLPLPRGQHAAPFLLRLSDLGGDALWREFVRQVLGDLQAVPRSMDDEPTSEIAPHRTAALQVLCAWPEVDYAA